MKILIITLFILCFSLSAAAEDKEIKLLVQLKKNEPKALKNPSEYKLEDGYLYTGSDYSYVGGTHVYADKTINLEPFAGKPVLLKGRFKTDLNNILTKGPLAPADYGQKESIQQLRSDWVGEETGFTVGQSTREKLKKVRYFHITEISAYNGITLSKPGTDKKVTLTFKNTLGAEIQKMKIQLHYEVNVGKPHPYYESMVVKNLKAGESVTREIATVVEKPTFNKKKGYLHSIYLVLKEESLVFDVELFVDMD